MTIKRRPGGKYVEKWRDAVALGRARKREARPKRDPLHVRYALDEMNLRYCQEVSFWNEHHVGKHGDLDGGLQWVDFIVWTRPRPIPIILDNPRKRYKDYEKAYLANKQNGLVDREMLPLVMPTGRSVQEYRVRIWMWMKKNNLK